MLQRTIKGILNENILNFKIYKNAVILKRFTQNDTKEIISSHSDVKNARETSKNSVLNIDWKTEMDRIRKIEEVSVLEPCGEDISHIGPAYKPSFNFAAYVNDSPSLQKLVKLGVDLSKIEKSQEIAEFILRLDFEKDVKKYVLFLHDIGVPDDQIGKLITKNPLILTEDMDNLFVRINYLLSKRFNKEMISTIVTRNAQWLSFKTQDIDERLGFFQQFFSLNGSEVRTITLKQPRLITYNLYIVKVNTFAVKEEMGFSDGEIKTMLLAKPTIWMKSSRSVLKTFQYIHNVMKIPHEVICSMPEALTSREFRIKQRHLFLKQLGKAQYDPKKENYVSLTQLVSNTDDVFCEEVAKTSVQIYNKFLKTL